MKKIFGRKSKDEEPQADSSFGRNNRTPTPQSNNPYAQNADSYASNADPYSSNAQPYANSQSSFRSSQSGSSTAARPGLPSGLPSGPRPGGQPPRLPSYDSAPPQYPGSAKAGSGYSDAKVGNSAGYGADRYNPGAAAFNSQYSATSGSGSYPTQRSGSYGGLNDSPQTSQGSAPPQYSSPRPADNWGVDTGNGFVNQEDMTEEQLEDAEVRDLKRQAHEVRQESKQSLANSRMMARQAIEVGIASTNQLREQRQRLGHVEEEGDRANVGADEAKDGTSKLDLLNSTPFFIPVGGKKSRKEDEERQVRRTQNANDVKEETRRFNYETEQKVQEALRGGVKPKKLGAGKADKYTFEDDDGTELADENEIDEGIDDLEGLVGQLNFAARGIKAELDADPDQIERIGHKMARANDKVMRTNAKMNQIR